MNDITIALLVVAATAAALSFTAWQFRRHKARRQHSLGDMYQPKAKEKESMATPHW